MLEPILVTGCCGFIGYHLVKKLTGEVIGIDNMNDYYDVALKRNRLEELQKLGNFQFYEADILDNEFLNATFKVYKPKIVINLAAQPGIRCDNSKSYIKNNILGFCNILECCKKYNVEHLIYASSSSVYGNNSNNEKNLTNPQSLYAATKCCNEVLAQTYDFNTTGLRFFTVYGENGRPDMFIYKLVKNALNNEPIELYGNGELKRDFTYIDDIVNGIIKACDIDENKKHRIYNLGSSNSTSINKVVDIVEDILNIQIKRIYKPKPKEDVDYTCADIEKAYKELNWKPLTDLRTGLCKFIKWMCPTILVQ